MRSFFRSLWASLAHLFEPSPDTIPGVMTAGDTANTRISAYLVGIVSFVVLHAVDVTGLLTRLGVNPNVVSALLALLTTFIQTDKKLQDGTQPIPTETLPNR